MTKEEKRKIRDTFFKDKSNLIRAQWNSNLMRVELTLMDPRQNERNNQHILRALKNTSFDERVH